MRVAIAAMAIGALLSATAWAGANPGDLDTTFSGDGKVRTAVGSSAGAEAIALADHGMFYAAGFTQKGDNDPNFLVIRYRRSGALDRDFSGDGIAKVDFKGGYDVIRAIAVQDDGRVVVGGQAETGGSTSKFGFGLARLKANGKLDPNFSGDGKVLVRMGDDFATVNDLEIQDNGRIVAGGQVAFPSRWAMARLLRSGRLDSSFGEGGDGRAVTGFPNSDDDQIYGVELDGDEIVVGGYAHLAATGYDFAAGRFDSSGVPLKSFSGDGFASVSLRPSSDYDAAYDMELAENGQLVLAGEAEINNGAVGGFGFASFTSAGNLDTSFNSGGSLPGTERESFTTSGDAYEWANALELQNNGRIVAVGQSSPDNMEQDFTTLRLLGGGGLDATFSPAGIAGVEFTDFAGSGFDSAHDVAILPNGNIVVVGNRHSTQSSDDSEVAVARYLGG